MKRTFFAVLVAGSLFAAPVVSNATPRNIEIISASSQASVQFAGSAENALFFNVKVNNVNGDKFTVTVSDKEGYVLFTQSFNDKDFNKKFKLVKSDDIAAYNFKITSANKELEQSFSVSAATKTVEDVTVTKL